MTPLIIESWIWWSMVMVIATCRFTSRRMTLGAFRRFQLDDYLMMLVLCFYTTLIVTINIVRHKNSNLLPPGFDVASLSPEDMRERAYGSKLILVVEQCQCTTIWGVKACLLTMYLRITTFRKENLAIKILAAYVAASFVVMEVLYFAVWCRPFHEYWAVPTDSVQCDAATHHLITNASFNLSSDLAMLAIALPMFLRLQLPWRKKVPVIGVFSLGIFVILAAILNKVYSFTDPFGSLWTYWYVRESSTALLVANLPFVWVVFKSVTGLKSIKASPSQTLDFSASTGPHHHPPPPPSQPDMRRKDSMLRFSGFDADWAGRDCCDDTEMASIRPVQERSAVTLEQMLVEESSCPSTATNNDDDDQELPNLYTHPLKYFSQAHLLPTTATAPMSGPAATPPGSSLDDDQPSFLRHVSSSVLTSFESKSAETFV